ncbi:CobW family GTP-binding protein [Algiphilus sp.]|uniref:CobW family GTP-binding protein n=1 Tax=Algiphilus sp. TaxID=1872431 RepID=UPI003C31AC9A
MTEVLKDIPVTLVTGLLGAGKTTLIDHLLEQRPPDERWAVLVNEFSKTGVDGARLAREGVYLREVAGGCMGCTAAVALGVELNRLLREARPHRLLVEPTGLGHPAELLKQFRSEHYRGVLSPRATICLVDARSLADAKFRDSPLWHQQLASADVLLGSKADLWGAADQAAFEALCASRTLLGCGIVPAAGGTFDAAWLDAPPGDAGPGHHEHGHHHHDDEPRAYDLAFPADTRFDADALPAVLRALDWERVKGSLRTATGAVRVDGTTDEINIVPEAATATNRLQLITHADAEQAALEQRVLAAASRA